MGEVFKIAEKFALLHYCGLPRGNQCRDYYLLNYPKTIKMKKLLRVAFALLVAAVCAPTQAQVVTTSPEIITENTKNVTITFHADWGNRGMVGLASSAAVYAHTGVITNLSTSSQDWKYAPKWNTPGEKYKMTNVGTNLWQLTIADLHEFYGVPATEKIEKLAFVFHTLGTSAKEGKTVAGGDIYVTIMPENFPAAIAAALPSGKPKLGVTANADGSATFCFIATDKKSVVLRGSWNNYALEPSQQMNYADVDGERYFWTTIDNVANGSDIIYYYLVDYQIQVGDPYAHLVLDGNDDKYISASVFPNMPQYPTKQLSTPPIPLAVWSSTENEYDWEITDFKAPNQENLVIYELLVRDFTGTNGSASASGTIAKATEKLDYIKALGCNAVELMPIMEFSGNNSWGYNPNFYMAPDKAYGNPDAYRKFIDEAHKKRLAVILDIVYNHVDGGHPWYNMYPGISTKFFNAAGTAPHDYSVFNDWKQENPIVEQQFVDACNFWMKEYKVDGFRFDLVKGMGYNDSYNNPDYNAATNEWGKPSNYADLTNAYNASRVARMKALHDAIKEVNPDMYFINENLATAQEENEMAQDKELNWANVNYASCEFAMGFPETGGLARFYAPWDSRTFGSTVSYAESHDEERMAYKVKTYGAQGVKGNSTMTMRRLGSVAAQMLLTPGSHMIWQFQELGDDQTNKTSTGNNVNPKKVVWNLLDNAANKSLHDSYAELLTIRNNNPTLFTTEISKSVQASALNNAMGARSLVLTDGNKYLWLVVNPTVGTTLNGISLPIMFTKDNMIELSQSAGCTATADWSKFVLNGLAPGAYAVFGTNDTAGIGDVEIDLGQNVGAGFAVTAQNGTIRVYDNSGRELAPGEFTVYTASGMRVSARALSPGIYLVNALGVTQKIALKN